MPIATFLTAFLAFAFLYVQSLPVEEQMSAEVRQQLRLQAEARVEQINKEERTWKAKLVPRLAELSKEEIQQQLLGRARNPVDVQGKDQLLALKSIDKKKKKRTTTTTTQAPTTTTEEPEEPFDAREEWPECADVIGKIQDQSGCGSCWAVSSASVMQDRICIESNGAKKVEISAKDLMACEPNSLGCNGGYPDKAFIYWESNGIVTGSNYTVKKGCKPYPFPPHAKELYKTPKCNHHCDSWRNWFKYKKDKHFGQSPSSLSGAEQEDIMQAIVDGGPVVASMIVYDDFIHYASGVYQHRPGAQELGGHAVRVIGWGVDETSGMPYWLVANSWNTDWGMDGYFKIARGQDECYFESWGIDFAEPKL